jgi:hypothetical protein
MSACSAEETMLLNVLVPLCTPPDPAAVAGLLPVVRTREEFLRSSLDAAT